VQTYLDCYPCFLRQALDTPGTILDRCADDFRQLYDEADLVIAKGQANYETFGHECRAVKLPDISGSRIARMNK